MYVREVSSSLLMLNLLLSQEAGKSNNISVNLLRLNTRVCVGRSHDCYAVSLAWCMGIMLQVKFVRCGSEGYWVS